MVREHTLQLRYRSRMSEGPDTQFRDHAANERTMLAWLRTGIALMAFGFAIARFALFLREFATARGAAPSHGLGSTWFGVALVVSGLVINLGATFRYRTNRNAIEQRKSYSPSPTFVYVVGIGSVLIAATMASVLAGTASFG
jgi:putative membrane protein